MLNHIWTAEKRTHFLALLHECIAEADGDGLIITGEEQPDALAESLMQLIEDELLGVSNNEEANV